MADIDVVVRRTIASAMFADTLSILACTAGPELVHGRANAATIILGYSGEVAFYANPQHASVTNYRLNLRAAGSSTVIDYVDVGVPTPDGNNVIVVDPTDTDATFYSAQPDGNYSISVAATTGGGTTDSYPGEAYAFSLPLA